MPADAPISSPADAGANPPKRPGAGDGKPLENLRLLLIEDDPIYRRALSELTRNRGACVLEADSYAAGFRSALADAPDFVIADLRLPDGRGDALCRELRRHGFSKPVVILTAQGDPDTQIGGFESGADEFWTKPIPLRLVDLRIRAILRRAAPPAIVDTRELRLNGFTFDFTRRQAIRNGSNEDFTAREIGVLEALWLAQGAPVSRADLLARVWRYDRVPNSRTVDNLIVALRRKLEPDPAHPRYLRTVNGVGYQLLPD